MVTLAPGVTVIVPLSNEKPWAIRLIVTLVPGVVVTVGVGVGVGVGVDVAVGVGVAVIVGVGVGVGVGVDVAVGVGLDAGVEAQAPKTSTAATTIRANNTLVKWIFFIFHSPLIGADGTS